MKGSKSLRKQGQRYNRHYKLSKVKSLIQSNQFIITGTARKTAAYDFAFSEQQIISETTVVVSFKEE